MSWTTFLILLIAVLVIMAVVLSALDDSAQAKAERDRERWENDAIDLTGGIR